MSADGASRTYRVSHRTTYRYSATMTDGYSVACLLPRPTERQVVREAAVELHPRASDRESTVDVFGNAIDQFGLHEPHDEMVVEALSVVELAPSTPPIDATPWDQVAAISAAARDELALEVGMFRSSSALVDLAALAGSFAALTAPVFTPGRPIIEGLAALCEAIHLGFEFDPSFSTLSTPLDEVVAQRRGVCQDFAHLAVGCLRSVGLPGRYVSGYIETVPPPGTERLVGADASHAWCSAWTPLAGWVDFDPTNGHLPVDDHVTVAWGRDYADVTPVRGVMIGPATTQELDVAVDVVRI